jgi:hypothetical protein
MTSSTINLVLLDEADPTVLYCRYPSQSEVQPCALYLGVWSQESSEGARHGEFTAAYEPNTDSGESTDAFRGFVRRYRLPHVVTAAAANKLLAALVPLAERVLRGLTVEWDGSNLAAFLDDDASAAEEEIAAEIALRCKDVWEMSIVHELDASTYYEDSEEQELPADLTADTTDEELAAIVGREVREAITCLGDGHCVLVGADEYLRRVRDEMR